MLSILLDRWLWLCFMQRREGSLHGRGKHLLKLSKVPSGKLTYLYGKLPFFNGKTHYKWPFSIAMLVYQRVHHIFSTNNSHWIPIPVHCFFVSNGIPMDPPISWEASSCQRQTTWNFHRGFVWKRHPEKPPGWWSFNEDCHLGRYAVLSHASWKSSGDEFCNKRKRNPVKLQICQGNGQGPRLVDLTSGEAPQMRSRPEIRFLIVIIIKTYQYHRWHNKLNNHIFIVNSISLGFFHMDDNEA